MRLLPMTTLCLLASFATAQTHLLRGKVELAPGTTNRFLLDGTQLPLTSSVVNLNAWIGQDALMKVVQVGTTTTPLLRVESARSTRPIIFVGDMHVGRLAQFEAVVPDGSFVAMYIDLTSNTGFTPLGNMGTYLLGATPTLVASGFTNQPNLFQSHIQTPYDQTLLGVDISGQAIVVERSNEIYLSQAVQQTVQP